MLELKGYNELMAILYKGYGVPDVPSRYIDRGMSFKKNEEKKQSRRTINKRRETND